MWDEPKKRKEKENQPKGISFNIIRVSNKFSKKKIEFIKSESVVRFFKH